MGTKCDKIRLYSLQTNIVKEVILKDGIAFSKSEYIRKKYGESAYVFLHNYQWFVNKAKSIVEMPVGAELPYWAFKDLYNIDGGMEVKPLVLEVPIDKVIFFDAGDWTKIMSFSYVGKDLADEEAFQKKLTLYGINTYNVITTDFYQDIKKEIIDSWDRLFRYNDEIKNGNYDCTSKGIQAALWCIKKEWVIGGI